VGDLSTEREEELHQSIAQIQEELFEAEEERVRHNLLLSYLQKVPVALDIVFPQDEQTPEQQRTKLLFLQRDRKVTEFMGLHAELQQLRAKVTQLRQANIKARATNQKLYQELKARNEEARQGEQSEVLASLAKDIRKEELRNQILRQVLQSLIVESGVNWARDPQLRQLMLSLEKPLPE